MTKKSMKKILSVTVAFLLVVSVFAAGFSLVTAERTDTLGNIDDVEAEKEIDFDPTDLFGEREYTPEDFPYLFDRPDVLDPELTQILSGSDLTGETLSSSNELMTDPHTIDQHSVEAVHDMGIFGDDVVVSLMDTGFDMAHPDLIGTHAVFEYDPDTMDPEMEMYDGYPIAFDPVSMVDYAYDGEISQDYELVPGFEDNSWYVNTSYETTTFEENDTIWANFTLKEVDRTYEMPDGVEEGDAVRFGLHPDDKLTWYYGERPAVLLTQDDEGHWAHVYVDLTNDRSFADEKAAYIDGDDPESEVITRDITGDGIADISGGMVYFVAREYDGEPMPIPYAEQLRGTLNTLIDLYLGYEPGTIEAMFGMDGWELITGQDEFYTTPESGDMIALMGDFNDFGAYGAHGTWTASAVVGQAVTGVPQDMIVEENVTTPYPPDPEGGSGLPRGLSPNATIIPMGRFFDYLPADNPLGVFEWAVPVTYASIFFTTEGYTGDVDITSDTAAIASSSFGRTIDENHGGFNFYERMFDYVGTQHTQNTLFINSQGNEGSGFGTVSAPSGAEGVLSVGASSNQVYRIDPWNMFDGGPNAWYGEVTGMTSTGPHSIGSHGPDIMTNGQFGYGADPVNQKAEQGYFQGNNSWTLWSGTSLSAPNAAGIAALVYQAYVEAHGEAPTAETLKNLIMQGANDMENTPFLQGPGDANALNSVLLAQGTGLYSEEFQWRPGTNPDMGEHIEHHVNIMEPGESFTDELTLHNWNDEDAVDYDMTVYREELVGSTQITLDSGPSGRVPLLAINETGVYELIYNETNDNWDLSEEPIAELDDPHADLFRFGTHTPYENQEMYDYSLAEFYNWKDVNENGSFDGFEERTRIGFTEANVRILELFDFEVPTSDYFTIHDALERADDGIIVQMNNDLYGVGDPWVTPFEFTLNIEQYNMVEWDWIDIDQPSGTVGAGETLEYEMTAEVPEDTPKGIYGGKLMIDDSTNDRTMPVPITITVGEYTDLSEPLYFASGDGDADEDFGIYRNDRLYGSWGGGLTGDWRFYTFHLEQDTEHEVKLTLDFDDERSDMSAFLLGEAYHDMLGLGMPEDPFSMMMPGRYGVNTLETIESTDIDEGDYVAFVSQDALEAGTYMIAVQSHRISGHEPYQEFSGELKVVNVRTNDALVITEDKATLHGEVLGLPNETVDAYFRYRIEGETEWDETEPQPMNETGSFEETLDDLEPDTPYEFKAVIEWEGDSEETGDILTFTPNMIPPAVHLYPDEGDIVQGDSLVISAELDEDHPVDEFEYVEISILEDWFDVQEAEIDGGYAWLEIPFVLSEGMHSYEVYVEDTEGNYDTINVNFEVDNSPPLLDITTPTNGVEELTYDEDFTIEGTTEPDVQVWINEEEVEVDEEGHFSYETILLDGLNTFRIVAEDEAGNNAETTVYALYLPELQELWEHVNDLWSEIEDIHTTIGVIQEDIDALDSAVGDLQGQVNTLQSDIAAVEDDITEIRDEIADMNELLEDMQADIEGIEIDLEAAEEDISNLEAAMAEAETDIATLQSDLAALQADLDEFIEEQEEIDAAQDDDISMAWNIGIIALILAILAIIIAIYAVKSKAGEERIEEDFGEDEFEVEEDPFEEEEDF